MEKNSSLPNAIVAFIDILGYKSLVEKIEKGAVNFGVIQWLENMLAGSSVKLIKEIKSVKLMPEGHESYEDYAKSIVKATNVKFISDTILVTLRLSDLSFHNFSEEDSLSNYLDYYFKSISMITTLFTAKTGLVFRGGIAMGPHYENLYPDFGSLFIFSRAYIKAYDLQKKAGLARILIDGDLLNFLREIPFKQVGNFIYRDDYGKDCVNTYSFLQQDDSSYSVLQGIWETVSLNLKSSKQNQGALDNLLYFAKYHNFMVTKLGFRELVINTKV